MMLTFHLSNQNSQMVLFESFNDEKIKTMMMMRTTLDASVVGNDFNFDDDCEALMMISFLPIVWKVKQNY